MSLDHKAFEFDWGAFSEELAPLLHRALADDDAPALQQFVAAHIAACSSPYDGEPLGEDWEELLETGTVQELADFALTKYYAPERDFGLSGAWLQLEASLPREVRAALLGNPLGPPERPFDPGLQGSYFQTPEQVRESVETLADITQVPLQVFRDQLSEVVAHGKGLYVTF